MSQSQRSWSMYPAFSAQIADILREYDIPFKLYTVDEPERAINIEVINISGSFTCKAMNCQRTIQNHDNIKAVVREYPKSLYSIKVFHQLCHYCNKLSKPILDETYGIKVAMCIKAWKESEVRSNRENSRIAVKTRKKDKGLTLKSTESTRTESIEQFSMYPELHEQVQTLLEDTDLEYSFYQIDTDSGCIDSYETNVCGIFKCSNKRCRKREWSSGIITVIIRQYSNNFYNARVYHQHCGRCEYISRPKLDSSYSERVSRRLKIWSGIHVEYVPYEFKVTSPHDETRCEGCLHGLCQMRNV